MNKTGNFHNRWFVIAGLFLHNVKISFRNILKYKSLSLINITGLAAGLICFALSMLWIRYEMSFDSTHKNAKQLYVVFKQTTGWKTNLGKRFCTPYAAYLKEKFPEIAIAAPIFAYPSSMREYVTLKDEDIPATTIAVDSFFFKMFDLKILSGSRDFLIPGSDKMAITQEKALQLFGKKNPIGTQIKSGEKYYFIDAVISGMPKPSNYPFDFIRPFTEGEHQSWNIFEANIIIELFEGIDVEAFEKKLKEHKTTIDNPNAPELSNSLLLSLNKMRYTDPAIERNVKIQDIIIFSIAGLLVVLCSLFNYFISMASRFRIRQKELALRLVFGASGSSLLAMLSVEFILILLFAVVLGVLFTQLFYDPFLILSKVQMDLSAIFYELFRYLGVVILVALLLFWLILFIFRRRSLNRSISRTDKKMFRKISIVFQLVISMFFVFCTSIIQKQMYFLHDSHEIGFSVKNKGIIRNVPREYSAVLANRLKQIPEITEVVEEKGMSGVFPESYHKGEYLESSWENKPADAENFRIHVYNVSPELVDFYDFQLLAGEKLIASDPKTVVLISEDAAKAYGWANPVGKQVLSSLGSYTGSGSYTVKGVVKNIYNYGPTQQIPLTAYSLEEWLPRIRSNVLFKYREGMWLSCKEKIDRLIKAEFADLKRANSRYNSFTIRHFEEEYKKILSSEIALQKLFSFFSVICILICVFGFVSLVSLTCKERRKSIAIRKINGATPVDILVIFIKEYALLLIVGSIIAFSAGYFTIQRWLENFVKHTNIPVWIYFLILFVMVLVIVLSVGHIVYKTSIENPSEVIKSE